MTADSPTRSPKDLAQLMAGRARLLRQALLDALADDADCLTELTKQHDAFRLQLNPDLGREPFADLCAEIIAYGLFAARLRDPAPRAFSRSALAALPQSSLLRGLFGYFAGAGLRQPIRSIVDDLANLLAHADLCAAPPSSAAAQPGDPLLHVHEIFLAAYDPAKRKARGVWRTPEPVVRFIVRAVDDILKAEFGLAAGLADASQQGGAHRVQILDPATGAGVFLAEAIRQIAPKIAPASWSRYVEADLIPRLQGFELLAASHALCCMSLDSLLAAFGYTPSAAPPPLRIHLGDALEADATEGDKSILCILGNPPYAGESANTGDAIMALMQAYKTEPGGAAKLKERNAKWINDDYVKFIRKAQAMIEASGEGVLAFVTPHGWLDNPTFRGMRWSLLRAFQTIYVLDLHGNAHKKETAPDGSVDENVFNIQQGVAIILAIRRKPAAGAAPDALAEVRHSEMWGRRAQKYALLETATLESLRWSKPGLVAPRYAMVEQNWDAQAAYDRGFSLAEMMPLHGNGVVTKRDALCIQDSEQAVRRTLEDFLHLDEAEVRRKYSLPADVRDWTYALAKADIAENIAAAPIATINYRPFAKKHIFYSGRARGLVGWPVKQVMAHYIRGPNIGLLAPKAIRDPAFAHAFVTREMTEAIFLSGATGSNAMNFPLYLYPGPDELDQTRRTNLDPALFAKLQGLAAMPGRPAADELAAFDYIYGALHSPAYRSTYLAFLKSDFPRIPWPTSGRVFWDVAEKGGRLRRLHLMEEDAVGEAPYPFAGAGDGVVGRISFRDGRIWINAAQGFDNAPAAAWAFRIGGYQPAQKWLKDRRGETLSFADIRTYQTILKILAETDRIMQAIDPPPG